MKNSIFKKSILLFLITTILLSLFQTKSQTIYATSVSGDYEYYVVDYQDYGIHGIEITKYTGSATDLVIPDKIGGYPVIEISYSAFYDVHSLKSSLKKPFLLKAPNHPQDF
jgi:hypothetical protein